MLAAFSMLLDQSDDKAVISQCLQGFRYAVHVTCIMSMQTQRDAFVTSMAKFTYLHHAADMKQKNVDAVKVNVHSCIFYFYYFFLLNCLVVCHTMSYVLVNYHAYWMSFSFTVICMA